MVRSRGEVALYMLNQKRAKLVELEQRFGVTVTVEGDPALTGMVYHAIERGELATPAEAPAPRQDLVRVDSIAPIFEPESEIEDEVVEAAADEDEAEGTEETAEGTAGEPGEGGERRRKRRRRRRGRDRDGASETSADVPQMSENGLATTAEMGSAPIPAPGAEVTVADEVGTEIVGGDAGGVEPLEASASAALPPVDEVAPTPVEMAPAGGPTTEETAVEGAPKRRRSRRTVVPPTAAPTEDAPAPAVEAEAAVEEAPKRRRRPSRARTAAAEVTEASPAPEAANESASDVEPVGARPSADRDVGADTVEHHAPDTAAPALTAPLDVETAEPDADVAESEGDRPKRSGWWQRAKSSFGA